MKRPFLVAVLAATLAAPALGGPIYMKIEGIDGDVTAAGRPGFIEVQSQSLGAVEQQVAKVAPRGGTNIPVNLSSIQISKRHDATSAKLMQASTKGHHFTTAVIAIIKPGASQPYMTYTLENCMISGYQTSASEGARPTESLSINFAKISANYKPVVSPRDPVLVGDPHAPAAKVQGSAQPAVPKN